MQDELPISGPLGLGDLLDRAFRLYRMRFWTLILIGAIFLIPLAIVSGVVSGQYTAISVDLLRSILSGSPGAFERLPATSPDEAASLGLTCLGYLIGIVGFVFGGLVVLAQTHQSISALHNQQPSAGESIRAGLRRLLSFIGMNLVQWLTIGILFAVALAPIACGLFSATLNARASPEFDGSNLLALGSLAVGCGLFLVIGVIAVYIFTRWIVAIPGIVAEQCGPLEALRRSWELTKGQFWRSLGYWVLLVILGWVITNLPGLVLQFGLLLLPLPALLTAVILNVAATAITLLWQPIYVAAIVLLYYDLRVRQEGYDLALRVEQLESEIGRPDTPGLEPGTGGV